MTKEFRAQIASYRKWWTQEFRRHRKAKNATYQKYLWPTYFHNVEAAKLTGKHRRLAAATIALVLTLILLAPTVKGFGRWGIITIIAFCLFTIGNALWCLIPLLKEADEFSAAQAKAEIVKKREAAKKAKPPAKTVGSATFVKHD